MKEQNEQEFEVEPYLSQLEYCRQEGENAKVHEDDFCPYDEESEYDLYEEWWQGWNSDEDEEEVEELFLGEE